MLYHELMMTHIGVKTICQVINDRTSVFCV